MSRELDEIAVQVKAGAEPTETVRTLLRRFGFEKRGYHKVLYVRRALTSAKLETDPDFNSVPLDAEIMYRPRSQPAARAKQPTNTTNRDTSQPTMPDAEQSEDTYQWVDPTFRMNRLDDGSQSLVTVRPDEEIRLATTLMMSKDYSQLPVISGRHTLKGIISWKTVGMRFALGARPAFVRDAMDQAVTTVEPDTSLFAAIPLIIESDYALVRRADGGYWIVTTADLSRKFRDLAEPFLLLGEIENQLRGLLDEHLTRGTIQAAKDPQDEDRRIEAAADLTLGEILRLLERQEVWNQLAPSLDRAEVVRQLDSIRNIRNDVMHFDPEGVGSDDLQALRAFARFLQDFRHYKPGNTRRR